jgi:hypothetical protein
LYLRRENVSELEQSELETTALGGVFDDIEAPQEESVSDRLRRARQTVAEQTTIDLDIPGYNGELFCKYRLLGSNDLKSISDHIVQTIRNQEERMIAAACDVLIRACDEFWVRDKGREIPVREVIDPPREFPVRFDMQLAEFLGYAEVLPDPPTARSAVLGLFGNNEIALAAHNSDLARWTMGKGNEVDMGLGGI